MKNLWYGYTTCDFCHKEVNKQGDYFVDGKTRYGPWGLMCKPCHKEHGIDGFGLGKAQKYSSRNMEKIEG